jgi:hypothetical protein
LCGGPGFPVFRLDADAAAAKDRAAQTLAAFEAADARVLVGTQMVAKGHDFPDVTLGVVLDVEDLAELFLAQPESSSISCAARCPCARPNGTPLMAQRRAQRTCA